MTVLVTLPEIKQFLSIKQENNTDDDRLSNIAIQVSELFSSYCGRQLAANTFIEYFDGGTSTIFVDNPPINFVYELSQYSGNSQDILGGPSSQGSPIITEGSAHSISFVGNPVITTRTKKFGRGSLKLDGSSYLTVPTSDDWDLGGEDFTIELFARFPSANSYSMISSNNSYGFWDFGIDLLVDGLYFNYVNGSDVINIVEEDSSEYDLNKWYHLGISRKDGVFTLHRESNAFMTVSSNVNIANFNTGLKIGESMIGFIDNLRINHDADYETLDSYPLQATETTKLLLRFDEANGSKNFVDSSRSVNQFVFYPSTGEISFGIESANPELSFYQAAFSNYPQAVKVTYNGGYKVIPADLKMAALEMIKIVFKGKTGSERNDMRGENIYAFKLAIDDFPPHVRRILNLYRVLN